MIALYFIIAYIGMWALIFMLKEDDMYQNISTKEKFGLLFIYTLGWPFLVIAFIISLFYEKVLDRSL